jgi:2-dehydropantoate 2-reductase
MAAAATIAIVGGGALGGYYGARLAQAGFDVHFLLRSDYDAVRANGLEIHSVAGDFSIPASRARVYRSVADMPKADLVIVALKTTANDQFGPLIAPLLKDDTAILTLQNGLGNEETLARLFGAQRILGGVCFVCINRLKPGVIAHTAHGLIRMGEAFSARVERVEQIAAWFNQSGVPCQTLADLRHGRWEKLLWNIPFNGLCTIMDLTTDLILARPAGVELVRRIMEEVRMAAKATGVTLDGSLVEANIRRTFEMGAYAPSMQIDRRAGRPMEIEAIFGVPLEQARSQGQEAPWLVKLYEMLRVIG